MAGIEQSVFSLEEDEDDFEVVPRLTRQQRGRQMAEVPVVQKNEAEDEERTALDRFLRDCGVENIETMSWEEKEQYANVLKESKQTSEQEEKARKLHKEQSQCFQGGGKQGQVRGEETGHKGRGQNSQNSNDSRRNKRTGRVAAEGSAESAHGAKRSGIKELPKKSRFRRIVEKEASSDSEFGRRQDDQNTTETISDSDETTDLNAEDPTEQSQREQLIESTFTLRPEGISERGMESTGLSLPLMVITEDTDSVASGVTHRSRFPPQEEDASSQGQSVQTLSAAEQSDSQDLDTSQTTLVSMADVCIQASLTSAGSWSEDSTDEPGKGHPSSCGDSPTFDSSEKTGRRTPLSGECKKSNESLSAETRGNRTHEASPDMFSSQAQRNPETLSDEETQIMDYGYHGDLVVDQDAETQDFAMETATHVRHNERYQRGVKRKMAPFEGREGASPTKKVHLRFDLFDPNPNDTQTVHADSIMKPLRRKYKYKYRDRMPLFAPSSEESRNYTAKIVHFFEEYRQQLMAAQCLLTQSMTWGEPVYTGTHMPGTLDVFVAGGKYSFRARCVQTPEGATGDASKSPTLQTLRGEDKENNQGRASHLEGDGWSYSSSPIKKQSDSQPFTSPFDFQDDPAEDLFEDKRPTKDNDSSDPDFEETFSSLQKYRKKRQRGHPVVAKIRPKDKVDPSPIEEPTANRPKKRAKKNEEEIKDTEDQEEPGLFEDFPSAFSQLKQAPSGRGRGQGRGRGRGRGRGKKAQQSERDSSRSAGKGRKAKGTDEVTIEDYDSDDESKDPGALITDADKVQPDTSTRPRRTLGTPLGKTKPVSEPQTPPYDPKDFVFKLGAEKRPPLRNYGRRGQAVAEKSQTPAAAAATGHQHDAETLSQGAGTQESVDEKKRECPICEGTFLESEIQEHCESCILQADGSKEEDVPRLRLNLRKRFTTRSNEGHTGDGQWQSPRKTSAPTHSATGLQLVPRTDTEDVDSESVEYGQCPVCSKKFASTSLVQHANDCLEQMEQQNDERKLRSSPRRLLPLATAPLATTPVQGDRKTRLQKQLHTSSGTDTSSESDRSLNLKDNIKHTWSDFTSSDEDDTFPISANQEGRSHHMTKARKTSPVKLPFQRISEQKDTMIDFHNQFKTADPKTLERKRNARMRRGRRRRTKRRRRRKPMKKDLTQTNKKLKKL